MNALHLPLDPDPALFPPSITVHVMADDIKLGIPRSGFKCPVSRAASRLFGGHQVGMGSTGLTVFCTPHRTYVVDEVGRAFVDNVDHERPVQPLSFAATLVT